MPRFYFDLQDGALIPDDIGTEFPNIHAAREAAIRVLSDVARDLMPKNKSREVNVLMRDETRMPVFTASLTLTAEWLTRDEPPRLEQPTQTIGPVPDIGGSR